MLLLKGRAKREGKEDDQSLVRSTCKESKPDKRRRRYSQAYDGIREKSARVGSCMMHEREREEEGREGKE